MEWTVQVGAKTQRVKLPDVIPDNVEFTFELDGKPSVAKWQRATKTLFVKDVSSETRGESTWQPLFTRNRSISKFPGESDVNVSLEFTPPGSPHTLCCESVVSMHVPGLDGRDSGASKKPKVVRSQITGKVLKVFVKPGDAINTGDTLLIVEAMKMENRVTASFAGTVESVKVTEGETISSGKELVRFN